MISIKDYIRHLTWLPVIWVMILIFGFSAENAQKSSGLSMRVSEKVVEIGEVLQGQQMNAGNKFDAVEKIEGLVRKTAHFTEYAVLAVLVFIAGYVSAGRRGVHLYLFTEVFCALYAVTDEVHQLFIEGRSCQIMDMVIDSAGSAAGIFIAVLLVKLIKYIKVKRMKKDKNVAF